jgi:hypothetical protein
MAAGKLPAAHHFTQADTELPEKLQAHGRDLSSLGCNVNPANGLREAFPDELSWIQGPRVAHLPVATLVHLRDS